MSISCLNSIGKFLYSVGSFIASPLIALIQKIQSLFANKIGNNSAASTATPPTIYGRASNLNPQASANGVEITDPSILISIPSMDGRATVLASNQNPQASANSDERVKLEGKKANLEREVAKISTIVTGMTGKKGPAARKRKAFLRNQAEVVLPARIAKLNNKISKL
jgi:hypothetical protein